MPLARVTGISSLSGCSAVLVRSSGWNWAESAKSWVSGRLPISNRPSGEPASTMPGPDVEPLHVDRLGVGGDRRVGAADRGDLAVGDDQRAVGDVGPADRVEGRPDEGVDPLGVRRDLELPGPDGLGRAGHRRCGRPAGAANLSSVSSRWNQTSPSIRASSQREKASNGWALKRAMSASLPTSIEPSRCVEAELAGGVDRDHRQRLGLGHAAVLDHLGGLEVEVADQLLAVALDADAGPGLGQQGRVVGDGVVGLDLVGPPVGEGRRAGAVGGDLGGDLVAFEHVLERLDPHAVPRGDVAGASGSRRCR